MSSRWAVNTEDDTQAQSDRKRKKEEKRRQKERKQELKEFETADKDPIDSNDSVRPAKRQRTTSHSDDTAEIARQLEFPASTFQHSGSLDQYKILNNIEEGSYGYVSRAENKTSGVIVALKKLKIEQMSDGFPVTGLREIQTLRACSHPHIVNLREIVIGGGPTQE